MILFKNPISASPSKTIMINSTAKNTGNNAGLLLQRRFLQCALSLTLICSSLPIMVFATGFAPPPVMLANIYRGDISLADYLVSEKLDGVRGYWDGEKLLTRGGERVEAPAWFTAGWPKVPLDGELWIARGQFSATVSIVRSKTPSDTLWRSLHFMTFDLPGHAGTFSERNTELQKVVNQIGQPWVRQVPQFKVSDQAALQILLKKTVAQGGEGLMLHRAASLYQATRNDDLLKLKLFDDAEAQVVAHVIGKGKYANAVGALEVVTPAGLRLRLGSGLSDHDRRNPPPVGSWVTYRYNGLNEKSGIPRFARFLRVREDMVVPASEK